MLASARLGRRSVAPMAIGASEAAAGLAATAAPGVAAAGRYPLLDGMRCCRFVAELHCTRACSAAVLAAWQGGTPSAAGAAATSLEADADATAEATAASSANAASTAPILLATTCAAASVAAEIPSRTQLRWHATRSANDHDHDDKSRSVLGRCSIGTASSVHAPAPVHFVTRFQSTFQNQSHSPAALAAPVLALHAPPGSPSSGSVRVRTQSLWSCAHTGSTSVSASPSSPSGNPSTAAASVPASATAAAMREPLSFCVVGSGPAGFYTADKLLKRFPEGRVTIVDRLPSPFGLIRTGVAPDHPETKFVTNQFTRVASHERCSFLGNVCIGKDVSIARLRSLFDAVILAYGAEGDKDLGIPGEGLKNSLSAREFVWWYNGHPDYVDLPLDLSAEEAVVLGQGNVALDVARVLVRSRDELAETDIAEHALEALKDSRVRTVHVVGRRGPVQAACTAKEVREVLGLKGVAVRLDPHDFQPTPADEAEMKASRSHKRVFELLSKAARAAAAVAPADGGTGRSIRFAFFRSPVEVLADAEAPDRVGGVRLEKTVLRGGEGGKPQRAVGTGETEDLPCGLVLRSIGYKSLSIPGLPFDARSGTVPNARGRVVFDSIPNGDSPVTAALPLAAATASDDHGSSSSSSSSSSGDAELYVVGWLKRGPTGIIGTNEIDAEETVASIMEDVERGRLRPRSAIGGCGVTNASNAAGDLQAELQAAAVRFVTFDDWLRIDWEERRRGKQTGRQRQKIVSVEEMLDLVGR